MTDAAKTATAIRRLLKKTYPGVEFIIKSKYYTLGDNVEIFYADFVRPQKIEELVAKYQRGHFDASTDTYENSNKREDVPQAKFIFVSRQLSEFSRSMILRAILKKHKLKDFSRETVEKNFGMLPEQLLWKVASSIDLPTVEETAKQNKKKLSELIEENS